MTRSVLPTPSLGPWLLMLAGLGAQLVGMHLITARGRSAHAPVEADHLRLEAVRAQVGNEHDSPRLFMPVTGARVPENPDLLPGARRDYRGGQHEGVDFRCAPGTPVRAAASGYVLSVDDEPNLPERRRNELLEYCRSRHDTPALILEVLHGRRLALCHGTRHGVLVTTSYSHLERINSTLKPGTIVVAGQTVGWAGTSGTSHAYNHDGWGELHFELRLDGQPVGVGLSPPEAAALYRQYLRGGHD